MSLILVACSAAQEVVAFSTFYVAAEGFLLKCANFCDSLSAVRVLCLVVIVIEYFLVFFAILLHRSYLFITMVMR